MYEESCVDRHAAAGRATLPVDAVKILDIIVDSPVDATLAAIGG